MEPITEFRMISPIGNEPIDRTTAGILLGNGTILDLGEVDTTDEPQDIPVRVIWWRVADMNGATELSNIRIWITGTDSLSGNDSWYMDITDVWTPDKTTTQVETGSPGTAPLEEPAANLVRIGGGTITGTSHDQTSRYIYLTGRIGIDETTGQKSALKLTVRYNYN